MHNKMAINTHLLTIEPKKTNQANKKNRDRIMDHEEHFDGCQMGGVWRNG